MVGSPELLSSWGGATWEKVRETGKVNHDRGFSKHAFTAPSCLTYWEEREDWVAS